MRPAPERSSPEPIGTVRRDVVDVVCRALEASGDPDRAKGQQAYMKSAMPLYRYRAAILRQLDTRLSSLSRREPLKNLG